MKGLPNWGQKWSANQDPEPRPLFLGESSAPNPTHLEDVVAALPKARFRAVVRDDAGQPVPQPGDLHAFGHPVDERQGVDVAHGVLQKGAHHARVVDAVGDELLPQLVVVLGRHELDRL
jgi:hypothetical protein